MPKEKKKHREQGMCVDNRKLNAVTITLPNVLPLTEDILSSLQDKRVFATLDSKERVSSTPPRTRSEKVCGICDSGWSVVVS